MDNTLSNNSVMNSVQQRTPTKRSKNNKKRNNNNNCNNNKHIKVVYISNPMKVKTSASEFRALVQELTGQDSELPPDPSKYQGFGSSDGDGGGSSGGESDNHKMDYDNCVVKVGIDDEDDYLDPVVVPLPPPPVDPNSNINCDEGQLGGGGGEGSSMESFEPFDEVFTPQMIENISSFLPSSVFYESPQQVDQVVMHQCNYVHP